MSWLPTTLLNQWTSSSQLETDPTTGATCLSAYSCITMLLPTLTWFKWNSKVLLNHTPLATINETQATYLSCRKAREVFSKRKESQQTIIVGNFSSLHWESYQGHSCHDASLTNGWEGNQNMVEKRESILNQAADCHSFIFYPQMSFFMIQTIWTVRVSYLTVP